MNDQEWDQMLHIRTTGRDDSASDRFCYPYEPTPYPVLERLCAGGFIGKRDHLLDCGCGKGRVSFFVSYQTGCTATGFDRDDRMIAAARENAKRAPHLRKVSFVQGDAAAFTPGDSVSRIYLFNPFHEHVLAAFLKKVRASYYRRAREILLFFYYPSDACVSLLMSDPLLVFSDEIDCGDLFAGKNQRERILIFEMS